MHAGGGEANVLPAGGTGRRPYTPAMRRWVCIIALLAGFGGEGYAWTARPRPTVPIERQLRPGRDGLTQTLAWWDRS